MIISCTHLDSSVILYDNNTQPLNQSVPGIPQKGFDWCFLSSKGEGRAVMVLLTFVSQKLTGWVLKKL